MALTQLDAFVEKQAKSVVETISGSFTTTATTGTITTRLKRVRSALFSLFPISNLAAAESLCIVATPDAAGWINVPSNGQLTVGRVGAAVTTGLGFSVRLEGY